MKAADTNLAVAPPIGLAADLAGASADQRRVVDLIAAGPRGSVPSPFLAMLDAPKLAEAIQSVGAVIRYGSTLPDALRELAILTTAVAVNCGYEWNHHAPIALAAGVSPATLDALRSGEGTETLAEPGASVIALCREVIAEGRASPEMLERAVEQLGRTGATEVVAIAGYYPLLAIFIKSAGFDQDFDPSPVPPQ